MRSRPHVRRRWNGQVAIWLLDQDCSDDASEPLNDALLQLLSRFDDAQDVLEELRADYELRVQCHGSSNSEQGGFWLGVPVLQRLSRLSGPIGQPPRYAILVARHDGTRGDGRRPPAQT